MKKFFGRLATVILILAFSCFAFGDDFKSKVIQPSDGPTDLPKVHNGQFMVIRNFTQQNGTSSTRGIVEISTDGGMTWVTVLSAAFVDATNAPDIINSVVVAGPIQVRATCGTGGGNCFISFKKKDG